MKKMFLVISLLVLPMISQAMIVKLPDSKVLKKRFQEGGFDHFIEKTKIIKQLANQEKAPLGVVMAVELALYDYNQDLGNPMMATLMQMRKPQIIKLILKDFEEAIKELEKLDLIK